jgi:hypothetical protein
MNLKKNAKNIFEKVNKLTAAMLKENLRSLSDQDLLHKAAEVRNAIVDFYPLLATFSAFADLSQLAKTFDKFFPGRGYTLANALMTGGGDITSASTGTAWRK